MVIAVGGPITNFFIIIASIYNCSIEKEIIIYSNLIIMLFNLLPIYPLDGGRILKSLIHIFIGGKKANIIINKVSNIIMIIITFIGSIAIYYFKNIAIFIIILFLWSLIFKENKKYKMIINAYNAI